MSKPTDRQIHDWLKELGKLVAPAHGTVEDRIAVLIPPLMDRYSDAEFNSATREHVARRCKFFPSYAEICDALDSLPSRQPEPDRGPDPLTGLTEDDRHWLAFWHKRRDEISMQTDGFKWRNREGDLANLASLVQQMSPRAWRIISPESVVIHDRPTDAQVAAVARALRAPGAPLAGRPMPGEGSEPVKPSYATGDALRRMREARGVRVA